jgi:ribose 5-phosphate isomerase B
MKIALGSDHAGWHLKEHVSAYLLNQGIDVLDLGPANAESVDYPDYARAVAVSIQNGQADMGILICGTGLGMAVTANKFTGIRAVSVSDTFSAEMSRAHNNANILTFGARVVGPGLAERLVHAFLNTAYEHGRHQRRIDKITQFELRLQK